MLVKCNVPIGSTMNIVICVYRKGKLCFIKFSRIYLFPSLLYIPHPDVPAEKCSLKMISVVRNKKKCRRAPAEAQSTFIWIRTTATNLLYFLSSGDFLSLSFYITF